MVEEKYIPLSFDIDFKTKFKAGQLVKILDKNGGILHYGYVVANSKRINDVPFVEIMCQGKQKAIKLVVTNAIQKI